MAASQVLLTSGVNGGRPSSSAPQKSLIKRTILEVLWEKVRSSYKDWTRMNDSVSMMLDCYRYSLLTLHIVFRSAHDSAKAVKNWMSELKK